MSFRVRQLSTRYTDEGIEFPSLNQSEQGVIKADVLRELHLATQGNRVNASEWDILKITMKACGGVASVSLTRSKGDNDSIPGHNASELIVSARGHRQGRAERWRARCGEGIYTRDASYAQLFIVVNA